MKMNGSSMRPLARHHPRPPLHLARSQPLAVVPKPLAVAAIVAEVLEQSREHRHDLGLWHQILQDEIQSRAEYAAAHEHRVLLAAAAHDADVALVGAHAAIGAAGHSDA